MRRVLRYPSDGSKAAAVRAMTQTVSIREAALETHAGQMLTDIGCFMCSCGMSLSEISDALLAANQKHCSPALPDSEVLGIARETAKYNPPDPLPNLLRLSTTPKPKRSN